MLQITNPAIDPLLGELPATTGGGTTLARILANGIRIVYIGGIIAFVFMLLLGAFEYITAGGDKDKTASASKRLTSALVGLLILFAVFAIFTLIDYMFGINVLQFAIPTIS